MVATCQNRKAFGTSEALSKFPPIFEKFEVISDEIRPKNESQTSNEGLNLEPDDKKDDFDKKLCQKIHISFIFNRMCFEFVQNSSCTFEKMFQKLSEIANHSVSELKSFKLYWIDDEIDFCLLENDDEHREMMRLAQHAHDKTVTIIGFCNQNDEASNINYLTKEERFNFLKSIDESYLITKKHILKAVKSKTRKLCSMCDKSLTPWLFSGFYFLCIICHQVMHQKCHQKYAKCPQKRTELINKKNMQTIDSYKEDSENIPIVKIFRLIGAGSYSKVFLGFNTQLEKFHAVKVIEKRSIRTREDEEWLVCEKAALFASKNCHFIVHLFYTFQDNKNYYFVSEFVSGGDLMFHLQKLKKFSESHAKITLAQIVLALQFLHERKIIFRDLKLDNILLDSDGDVKLTDFGMCKILLDHTDLTYTFCGTPNYLAPEIILGNGYSFTVDVWSLGILTFELLVGYSPFYTIKMSDENAEKKLFDSILNQTIRIPRFISIKAASLMSRLLQRNPKKRFYIVQNTAQEYNKNAHNIKNHAFFADLNWDAVDKKQIKSSYIPSKERNKPSLKFSQKNDETKTAGAKSAPTNAAKIMKEAMKKSLSTNSLMTCSGRIITSSTISLPNQESVDKMLMFFDNNFTRDRGCLDIFAIDSSPKNLLKSDFSQPQKSNDNIFKENKLESDFKFLTGRIVI